MAISEKRKEYERQYRIEHREHYRLWREKNKELLSLKKKKHYQENKEVYKERAKKWSKEHPEETRLRSVNFRKRNSLKIKQYRKKYNQEHKEDIRISKKKWKKSHPHHGKLEDSLRIRLYHALKGNSKKGSAVRDLGCTIPEFKLYIEGKFEKGMNWDNWSPSGWHIDHNIPLSFFDLTDREQLLRAIHYTNLQPMWATKNMSKGGWSRSKNVPLLQ